MSIIIAIIAGALIGIFITLCKRRKAAAQAEADRQILQRYYQNKKDLEDGNIMIVKLTVLIAFHGARDGLSKNQVFINLLSDLDKNCTPQARVPSEMKAQIDVGYAIYKSDPDITPAEVFAMEVDTKTKLPVGWQA